MQKEYYTLKEVMDDLVENAGFHIGYPNLRQFYKYGTLNKKAADLIIEKKKVSNISYYIEKDKLNEFKEALFEQFL